MTEKMSLKDTQKIKIIFSGTYFINSKGMFKTPIMLNN